MAATYLLKGGRVIDPANGIDKEPLDVLMQGSKIICVGEDLQCPSAGCQLVNVANCIVCPGLIDMHVHCFPGGTILGVDPDKWALQRGVTSVVDAGSAGAANFESFLSYSKSRKTQMFYFLHASRIGLENAGCTSDTGLVGEIEDIDNVNIKECLDCIAKHSDKIIGIKIRLAAEISNNGKNEMEAYERSLSIAANCSLPLMVHHSFSTIPVTSDEDDNKVSLFGKMRKGDIRTHMCHEFISGIMDHTSLSLNPKLPTSRKMGIIHDVGHGQGSFSWNVAELCAKEKFWPDTISSDLHKDNINGPCYDLTTVMTKFFYLGMPLYDIIKAVTYTPAKVIGKENSIGSLLPGRCADVTVLKISKSKDVLMEDCHLEMRKLTEIIEPVHVWRCGEMIPIECHWAEWPNKSNEYFREQSKINEWKKDEVANFTN